MGSMERGGRRDGRRVGGGFLRSSAGMWDGKGGKVGRERGKGGSGKWDVMGRDEVMMGRCDDGLG